MYEDPIVYKATRDGEMVARITPAPEKWPLPQGEPSIALVLSQPRLCFTDQSMCLIRSLMGLPHTTVHATSGFPWEKALSAGIGAALKTNPDYVVFADYDGVFTRADLLTLVNTMQMHPELGAIYPVQAHRHKDMVLVEDPQADYVGVLTETEYAHFGLTVIRRQVFEMLPEPWFWSMPNPTTYSWSMGSMDADIFFWTQCRKAGVRVARHNGVQIGHMELMVFWTDADGKRMYQTLSDYRKEGKPAGAVWGGPGHVPVALPEPAGIEPVLAV